MAGDWQRVVRVSRRELIGTVATTGVVSHTLLRIARAADDRPPLRETATTNGRHFGSAVSPAIFSDRAYGSLIATQCDMLVPENALCWDKVEPARGRYEFGPVDAFVEFAEQHAMLFRGTPLIWHERLPGWLEGWLNAEPSSSEVRRLIGDRITTVMSRYRGRVQSWDVVNEAIEPSDHLAGDFRRTPFLRLLGEDYIEFAYRVAAAADPASLLVYNDNYLEQANDYCRRKRASTLRFLERFKARGTPIGAIGLQGHLIGGEPISAHELRDFLRAVTGLGLALIVTELDVIDRNLPASIATRDAAVADLYRQFLDIVLAESATVGVLAWGLSDRYSWLEEYKPRGDNLPVRGNVFDAALRPKPSFASVSDAFHSAPPRGSARPG